MRQKGLQTSPFMSTWLPDLNIYCCTSHYCSSCYLYPKFSRATGLWRSSLVPVPQIRELPFSLVLSRLKRAWDRIPLLVAFLLYINYYIKIIVPSGIRTWDLLSNPNWIWNDSQPTQRPLLVATPTICLVAVWSIIWFLQQLWPL